MPKTSKENRKLHAEWRAKVLARDGCCQICGKSDGMLNAHHLIPKEFKIWRWDVRNGIILCVQHHTLGKFSAHKHPIWFTSWLSKNRPDILYEVIERINSHQMDERGEVTHL